MRMKFKKLSISAGLRRVRVSDGLISLLFVLYFGADAVYAIFRYLGIYDHLLDLFNTLYLVPLLLACAVYRFRRVWMSLVLYAVISVLFLVTYAFHPEYADWFSHSTYGIVPQFLSLRGGIWAFLLIGFVRDPKQLLHLLLVTAWVCLFYYVWIYTEAMQRGYWVSVNSLGATTHSNYNLVYGYDMLYPAAVFAVFAFLRGKRLYYIPFALCTLLVLLAGSRGPILWLLMMFVVMVPIKWNHMTRRSRIITLSVILLLFPLFLMVYNNFNAILLAISTGVTGNATPSRTVMMILNNSFSDDNGRQKIYEMANELIQNGGAFGHGVYGDRYVIGRQFSWGYSHNLFLEWFVSFGYIGGTLVSAAYLYMVFRMYLTNQDLEWQCIFTVFFTNNLRLLVSDSFWYNKFFWGLLMVCILWMQTRRRRAFVFAWQAG